MTIEEYETESGQIAELLLATADGLARFQDDRIASKSEFVDDVSHGREDHPRQYWHWTGAIELAPGTTVTPEQAADRMATALEDEGWTGREPDLREAVGKYDFRLPGGQDGDTWSVGITFRRDEPPAPQSLDVEIVSPSTDRTAADS